MEPWSPGILRCMAVPELESFDSAVGCPLHSPVPSPRVCPEEGIPDIGSCIASPPKT